MAKNPERARQSANLYETVAEELSQMIRVGVLKPGDRLPSLREVCNRRAVSQSTVMQAFAVLEHQGLIEARARRGYFVSHRRMTSDADQMAQAQEHAKVQSVDVSELVFHILDATRARKLLPFGSAFPSPALFPLPELATALARSVRHMDPWSTVTDLPPGNDLLRQEISRRYLTQGVNVMPDDILITNGAMEALSLSLEAVAPRGSLVAIESPAFYGALQCIERLGLNVVLVPTDPIRGVRPDALRRIIDTQPVTACWFMSHFQNPLGASIPDEARSEIVSMLAERDIPLIEDDVYAELYFSDRAPGSFKSFDAADLVLHCGSFSKCLAPGYRVGWVASHRYGRSLTRLKSMSSMATSIPAQGALAQYLQRSGRYDKHLRKLRSRLASQQDAMLSAMTEFFPEGTTATRAEGGYFTWVSLPNRLDVLQLHRLATAEGIGISPGPMFSPDRNFSNCMRMNFGHPWGPELQTGIERLGALAHKLVRS